MATNLNIDMRLLQTAVRVGGMKTKRETVNEALRRFIRTSRQKELKKFFGKVDLAPRDYKRLRTRS
jgi:Arc/MetJ family transcription regulator